MTRAVQEAVQTEPEINRASSGRIPWGWVVATAVGMEIATIASAVAWVAFYSYVIHPGEDSSYYQEYAQVASPVVAVVVTGPFWFFGCRWIARKAGTSAIAMSLWVWVLVFLIDLPLMIVGRATGSAWVMFSIANSIKLVAAYLGGRAALAAGR
jgi:hypothetical protein